MEIRNLMEDEVIRLVNEICDEEARTPSFGYCTLPECRMDAACFVLNRVPQKYVTSGRGMARFDSVIQEDAQLSIDLVTLAHEGLRRVSTVKRSFYQESGSSQVSAGERSGPTYSFPLIRGRVLDGTSFEKISEISISLLLGGERASMLNSRFQNPYRVVANNPGSYLFWPGPLDAEPSGGRREFEFEISVADDEKYEPFRHLFHLSIQPEAGSNPSAPVRDYVLEDFFLVPR